MTLYFSGTGNTEYIANLFSRRMGAVCLSIEDNVDFAGEISAHDTLAFCYPVYGSRLPRIMRDFVAAHMPQISGKKLVVFAVQMIFSGDGARVFADMFNDMPNIVYAEHFMMPNNVCNTPLLRPTSPAKMQKYKAKAEGKMGRVCDDIRRGVVKKRGFSRLAMCLGSIQGRAWQGDSKISAPQPGLELKAKNAVRIHSHCNMCAHCTDICPMKNLAAHDGRIVHLNNCTVCYRCVNRCPQKAITVLYHRLPKWQYDAHVYDNNR